MGYTITALKGIGWLGNLQIIVRILTVIKLVVIARFLSPSEYGSFALIIIGLAFVETLFEIGIPSFLIQSKEDIRRYISTAWVLSLTRGFLIFCIVCIGIVPFAIFFNAEDIIGFGILAACGPLMKGFVNPGISLLQKELKFQKEVLYRAGILLTDVLISITLVIVFRSILGLVFGLLSSSLIEVLLSWILVTEKPRFVFEKTKALSMLHFGKWIVVTSITSFLMNQLDNGVVGRILGTGSLGIYQLSQKFSINPLIEGTDLIAKVTFPIYAKIKDDKKRLQKAYFKIFATVFGIGILISGTLFIFANEIIMLLAGPEWYLAVAPLRIFAILAFFTALVSTITTVFLALGKQHITAKLTTLRLIVLAVLVIPATSMYGIQGAALSSLFSFLIIVIPAFFALKTVLFGTEMGYNTTEYAKSTP